MLLTLLEFPFFGSGFYIHFFLFSLSFLTPRMRLKGQMIYVPETDLVLFLCSPSVLNLDDLNRRGLYLSDIPLHDSTRDLILLSEQFEAEYKLTKNLEILTDKLQQTYRELEDEKRKTDRLVGCSVGMGKGMHECRELLHKIRPRCQLFKLRKVSCKIQPATFVSIGTQ